MSLRYVVAGLTLGLAAAPATAEPVAEYPNVVGEFLKGCTEGELTATAREAALAANGWTKAEVTIDPKALNISRAIDKNFDFAKPVTVSQWTKTIDGAPTSAIVATYPEKRRYPSLCAIIVPDVKQGWTYHDAMQAGMQSLGIKGKSTDLPHYFEYASKLANGHPARAELFARSQALGQQKAMHLYIAF
jgi:hypothetical protein